MTHDVISETFRREWPILVAATARITRDLSRAEDIVQEVLAIAVHHWARAVPERPGAWLMAAARNRALNQLRNERHRSELLARHGPTQAQGAGDEEDALGLVLACCHPALPLEAQVALTLRTVCGLSTAEIARAFLAEEATIAQRIVRAKRTIGELALTFSRPEGEEVRERLPAALGVIYLVFNEGYAASAGDRLVRDELCRHALLLGELVASELPRHPDALGLLALMRWHAVRLPTRVDGAGRVVPLEEQDRTRWNHSLVPLAEDALSRALAAGAPGPLTIQAQISACHTRAATFADTPWPIIVGHYDALLALGPSPVIELNRAMALAMSDGPLAGLKIVRRLVRSELAAFAPAWAARGELLRRAGDSDGARASLLRAAALATNDVERRHFETRAAEAHERDHRQASHLAAQ